MTALSGWCATTAPNHTRDHNTCQQRLDTGLLPACSCQQHGGHQTPQEAA